MVVQNIYRIKYWFFALMLIFLSACGGGGETAPPASDNSPSLILSLPTISVTLNEDFSTFPFNTTATTFNTTAADLEEGALLVTISGQDTTLLTVDVTTNQIVLTSIANANGISTLTVNFTDSDNLSATAEVVVTINPINDTPVLTLSTTNLTLDEDFSTFTINTSATDVEEGALLVTVSGQDTTLLTVDVTTNQITLTSIANASGISTLTVNVTDSDNLSASTEVVVTINPINDTPVLTLSTTNLTLNEDFSTFTINTSATDVEEGALLVTVSGQDTTLLTVDVTTNQITLTSIANASGISTLTVNVTDSGNLSASTEVVVTINPINDTPTLALSTTNITLNEDFSTFTINTSATDVEEGALLVTVSGQDTSLLTVDVSTNQITLTSIANASGISTFTVNVTDSNNLSASTEVVVTINPINDTPTLALSTTNITLNEDFSTFSFNTTATDVEDGTLLVTVSGQDTSLLTVDVTTNQITLTSIADANGISTLTVNATDSDNLSSTAQVVVTINAINDTPTLSLSSTNFTLDPNTSGTLTAFGVDIDSTSLTYSVQLTSLLQISIQGNIISLASANTLGSTTLVVTVTDEGGLSASATATVRVSNLLNITLGLKQISFSWTAVPQADHYRLLTNLDLNVGGGFVDASTVGLAFTPNSTNITNTTTTAAVNVVNYLSTVNGPQYLLQLCTSTDNSLCSDAAPQRTLSNTQLNGLIGYFKASNTDLGDQFAGAVSISSDGNTFVVGARLENSNAMGINGDQTNNSATDAGAAYVFVRSGTGTWSQQAYIKASNANVFDEFGGAVSVSGDGNTLVVGAQREDSNAVGINGDQTNNSDFDAGAVYVFVRSGTGTWSQQAYIKASNTDASDRFGAAVSISGDGNTLVVGAELEDSNAAGINGNQTDNTAFSAGAVYVFVRSSTGTWSQQAYIKPSSVGLGDRFGGAVAISGDGNNLIVGAIGEDSAATGINGNRINNSATDAGAAYVFVRSAAGAWSQQAYIKASNTDTGDTFGEAVSVSGDGNTLVVGAPLEDGNAMGINEDQINNSATNAGAAYVFVRSATGTWSQQAYVKASNTGTGDGFGEAVSVSGDGNTLIVGATLEDSNAVGINMNQINNSASSAGAAYFFVRSATGTWSQQAYVKASNTDADDRFGAAVSVSGDGNALAVGASLEDSNAVGINGVQTNNSASNSGAVYLY